MSVRRLIRRARSFSIPRKSKDPFSLRARRTSNGLWRWSSGSKSWGESQRKLIISGRIQVRRSKQGKGQWHLQTELACDREPHEEGRAAESNRGDLQLQLSEDTSSRKDLMLVPRLSRQVQQPKLLSLPRTRSHPHPSAILHRNYRNQHLSIVIWLSSPPPLRRVLTSVASTSILASRSSSWKLVARSNGSKVALKRPIRKPKQLLSLLLN